MNRLRRIFLLAGLAAALLLVVGAAVVAELNEGQPSEATSTVTPSPSSSPLASPSPSAFAPATVLPTFTPAPLTSPVVISLTNAPALSLSGFMQLTGHPHSFWSDWSRDGQYVLYFDGGY